jgi:hypothetical protein
MKRKHIAVDLDGVLVEYSGDWRGEQHFGPPMPGAIEWVEEMLARGHRVTVFTGRKKLALVQKRLMEMGFPRLRVTNTKDRTFSVIVDDRALTFDPELFDNPDVIDRFEPYWK